MTAGKNPRNFKKKGNKKKLAHPFIKKEWYNVLAPSIFETGKPTLTLATRPLDRNTPLIPSEVVSSRSASLTCRMRTTSPHGERFNSRSKK
jgi:ribosomal protein S3AE